MRMRILIRFYLQVSPVTMVVRGRWWIFLSLSGVPTAVRWVYTQHDRNLSLILTLTLTLTITPTHSLFLSLSAFLPLSCSLSHACMCACAQDRLLCLGCKTLRECIARRYNLEVKEVPLYHLPSKGKAEAAAKNRLVHRRLLAEMEAKAGFKPKSQKQDSPVKKGGEKKGAGLAPTAIAQDAARDAALDEVAAQVVQAATWNAQQDAYSDALVENGRRASLYS